MNAPVTRDPLVLNLRDGSVWTRRAVSADGRGSYALAGVCDCPEYVLASFAELAERGIVGSADALLVPVGPERHRLLATRTRELVEMEADRNRWKTDVKQLQDRVAELQARPSRADVLRQAADDLTAACPDHGDADEAWMDCPCEFADELRRKAALAEAGGAG